jgi:hypothetical protein
MSLSPCSPSTYTEESKAHHLPVLSDTRLESLLKSATSVTWEFFQQISERTETEVKKSNRGLQREEEGSCSISLQSLKWKPVYSKLEPKSHNWLPLADMFSSMTNGLVAGCVKKWNQVLGVRGTRCGPVPEADAPCSGGTGRQSPGPPCSEQPGLWGPPDSDSSQATPGPVVHR